MQGVVKTFLAFPISIYGCCTMLALVMHHTCIGPDSLSYQGHVECLKMMV